MFEVGNGSTGEQSDIDAIIQVLREAGTHVGKDVEGVVGMFQPADSTILFDYLAPGVTTLDDLRETVESILALGSTVTCEYPKITVHVLTDQFAYSVAYCRVVSTGEDESTRQVTSSVTDIWQKFDGSWRAIP